MDCRAPGMWCSKASGANRKKICLLMKLIQKVMSRSIAVGGLNSIGFRCQCLVSRVEIRLS